MFNVLLQLLDDGRLTDSQGRTVDFKNTVVIMTSNIGSAGLVEAAEAGDDPSTAAAEAVRLQLREHFRPEFLNRVDEIIVFRPLDEAQLMEIVGLLLAGLEARLADSGVHLELTDAARAFVAREGYDPTYGARPLRRAIQRSIENPLAKAVLAGEYTRGDTVRIDVRDGALTFEKGAAAPAEPADDHRRRLTIAAMDETDRAHHVDRLQEGVTMALYISISLLAVMLALPRGLESVAEHPAEVVGLTGIGLIVAHLAAFTMSSRLVSEGQLTTTGQGSPRRPARWRVGGHGHRAGSVADPRRLYRDRCRRAPAAGAYRRGGLPGRSRRAAQPPPRRVVPRRGRRHRPRHPVAERPRRSLTRCLSRRRAGQNGLDVTPRERLRNPLVTRSSRGACAAVTSLTAGSRPCAFLASPCGRNP